MTPLPIYKHLGLQIKSRRKSANISQQDFADMLELNRTSISNIENGVQRITVESLHKICGILNCQYTDLLPPIIPVVVRESQVEERKEVVKIKTKKFI